MQERTTIILERLANLRLHSITVFSPEDVSGVLHRWSQVFAKHDINLTGVDSHDPGEGMKFMIGEEGTDDQIAATIIELEELGFQILQVKSRTS